MTIGTALCPAADTTLELRSGDPAFRRAVLGGPLHGPTRTKPPGGRTTGRLGRTGDPAVSRLARSEPGLEPMAPAVRLAGPEVAPGRQPSRVGPRPSSP